MSKTNDSQQFHQYQQSEQSPPILTERTQETPRHMTLEIQALACGMTTNVAGFNRLMGFQPSLLDKRISNCNIYISKR